MKIQGEASRFEQVKPLVRLIQDYPHFITEILGSFLQDYATSKDVESAVWFAAREWDL